MKRVLVLLFLALLPLSALAHKISAFVDVEGNTVTISSFFSDGTPVKGGDVEVFKDGKLLLKGKTDKNGEFTFKAPQEGKYKVVVVAELGHRTEAEFTVGKVKEEKEKVNEEKKSSSQDCQKVSEEELRKVVREELKPIKQELLQVEEELSKPNLSEIIGGIGWILGIFGGAVLLSRRKSDRS
ncbi:emp24/gp25L/p24 family protein [Thermovibrio sp.]